MATEIGRALRRWRDRLPPLEVGLPTATNRRAPGLRREELAQLAGISVDYLTRLEQGRVPAPSAQVLESLARALRLTSHERKLLFELARRVPQLDRMRTDLTPSVSRLVEQVRSPVCVYDACWTQLSWNRAFAVLFGDPSAFRGLDANLLYRYLTGAPSRAYRPPHDTAFLSAYIADLRVTHARFPSDPRITKLVRALIASSTYFASVWQDHPLATMHETRKTIEHVELGRLDLDCDVLSVEGAELRIVLFTAPPGSAQADALEMLASLPITPVEVKSPRG